MRAKIRSVLIADAERGELRLPGHKKTVLFHDLCDKYIEHAKLNLKNKGWITVRAQLKPVTPGGLVFHSVRHTTASRLALGGVDQGHRPQARMPQSCHNRL